MRGKHQPCAHCSKQPTPGRGGGRPVEAGLRALELRLKQRRIDGRSSIARALKQQQLDYAADEGGMEQLPYRVRRELHRAAVLGLLADSYENFIFEKGPLTAAGEPLPALANYVALVQAEARILDTLGLRPQRDERSVTLADYLSQRATATNATDNGPETVIVAPEEPVA